MKKIALLFLTSALCSTYFSCNSEYESEDTYSDGSGIALDDSGDTYNEIGENPFIKVSDKPKSTFSIDADGGSYANCRRFILQENRKPPVAAVRTEEFINYFDLDYTYSDSNHPININSEISTCPWNNNNKLVRIGLKGKPYDRNQLPASNFVFLIDVSGSMGSEDKLQLLKNGFIYFVDNNLTDKDQVAIVTYAGNAGVVLPSTLGSDKQKIKNAINSLGSGGSTAGAEGITTAYEIAQQNFITNGNNRIIVGTDGDFNVGISSQEELIKLVEQKREEGVFLSVLGVGRGNLREGMLEQIANNGNGNYEYIDSINQLKKVFVYDYNKFFTVAKDVKIQVEFNPEHVNSYRLIGYENRVLSDSDFDNDKKDAGELGVGQSITALYEIIPNTSSLETESLNIKLNYKIPTENTSIPLELKVTDENTTFSNASNHMRFAASVAAFAMTLTDSDYKGTSSYDSILQWLNSVNLNDNNGYKSELKTIINKTKSL